MPFRPNPYIIGVPIRDPNKFFGREPEFSDINDSLQNNEQLILLYGQRRIGKSSVIAQIPKKLSQKLSTNEFVFISFDFNSLDFNDEENLSTQKILSLIAIGIIENLETNKQVLSHLAENIPTNIEIFSREFLPTVYQQLGNKKLVLLWDEFDVLTERDTELDTYSNNFCNYIIQLLQKDNKLFIIPIVGRHISKLGNLSSFFRGSPNIEIGLLNKEDTQKLIIQPDENILNYEEEAIQAIFQLSAGHPYFTQCICYAIHNLARDRHTPTNVLPQSINGHDVKSIVDRAIGLAEGGLDWFWRGLTTEQQVIFTAAAEAQNIPIKENEPPQLMLLRNHGIETEYLKKADEQLHEYGFLDNNRVKVEFVRRWLVKSHKLKDEISNLETVKQENINKLLSVADDLREHHDTQAVQTYELALKLNPNNFKTVTSLADEYLKIQELNKACELYERAYHFYSFIGNINKQQSVLQPLLTVAEKYSKAENFEQALEIYRLANEIDSESSKDGFLQTIENYVHKLIIAREWIKATERCQLGLKIDPNRISFQQRLKEIQALRSNTNLNVAAKSLNKKPSTIMLQWLNRISRPIASLGLAGVVVIGVGISQGLRTCPPSERKAFGVFCVADNSRISRGNSIFFSEITNTYRDKGIQAFQQANYQEAITLFQQAVDANRYDPEVLIYYNNSLARQQGSPFTLAVVVSLDKNKTTPVEVLRGVAQAQDQFNRNKGLNRRLLEIVIANDSNTKKAKEVAQELTKDSSIIGVIGHNSSEATRLALPEYEKAKLALVSPTSASIFLNNPVFFRAVNSDESTGKTLAEYTYKTLQLKKAVVFGNPSSTYSNSIREIFTNQFEKLGGEVVRKPLINLTASKFDPEKEVTNSVYDYKAEAALLFPDADTINKAIPIAKEITKINKTLKTQNPPRPELKMLAGDTLYTNETLTSGGNNVEGLIIAVPWFRETSQAQSFAQKSARKWGGDISWRTATSFDATQALIKTLSNNATRDTVLRDLENVSLSASETSGYPLRFTSEREREGQSILLEIKGGKFVEITP
ncbi:ABC transporter substrate-binding protein [Aphanizomenon flos-aquae NRERC-008]|uniref:ABC transporter substrate-binding protein n=2 Tax=Aphanizomenon flos-aquae TaxID=1176 RepID=A0ABR8IVC8_APHFL|nr:ABC transporter substrate-binding protein [Aphanizomenon flos-aquae]MBD2390243.1 ABC transporter substrate-binding protein [Aphanizomenon flos-aquae FACHB-1171]MBD2555828.1 ABC transporter substrate-binding protein [Aphanizomenon flos-aquae FACHB-1290]MBD2657111.1 ABC transporter substrate-binding protein [Aphanizomenon flos-aquae FACHB-1265]MBD2686153.1 ABC transporter substrate-binding protein [Aphanizomenon flos-aquae FACHB-1249]MBD2696796.1 ABC transporter substrate-binding protein [Aph